MKQVVLNIPDNKYLAFINFIKRKFTDIRIEEKKSSLNDDVLEEDNAFETALLSEKSLAEDWLSDEDSRWDELL